MAKLMIVTMDRLRRTIVQILEKLISLIFIVISGITLTQVFCRYILGFSLAWSHEVVILLFIWAVWLCIPVGVDRQSHLRITILQDKVSASSRIRLFWLSWAFTLFFFLFLFLLTFPVLEAFDGIFLTTIRVPVQIHYCATIIGSLVSAFILVSKLFQHTEKG